MADWNPQKHPFLTDVSQKVLRKDDKPTVEWVVDQGPWKAIFADQQLDRAPDVDVENLPTKHGEENGLYLTWTPTDSQGNKLLEYQFSSDRNSSFFLDGDSWNASSQNTATAGVGSQSGVLLLRPLKGTQAPLKLQQTLLPAFGIVATTTKGKLLTTLLSAVDASGAMTATVKSPPAWSTPTEATSPSFNLPTGVNVRDRTPINGLWCHTADSCYTTAISVTYLLKINPKALADWLRGNFGGVKPKAIQSNDDTATIDVEMTFKKSTTFTVATDSTGKVVLEPIQTTVLSVAFPLGGDFTMHVDLIANSAREIRVLLVPIGHSSIFGMISSAFDGLQTTDIDMLPRDKNDTGGFFDLLHSVAQNIDLRFWYGGLTLGQTMSTSTSINWEFGIIVVLHFGTGTNIQHLPLAFSYNSLTGSFIGQTIFKHDLPSTLQVRGVSWDPRLDPAAVMSDYTDTVMDGVSVLSLIGLDPTESLINPTLKYAAVSVTKGSLANPSVFTLTGRFSMAGQTDPLLPKPWLSDEFAIDLEIQKLQTTTSYFIRASNTLVLRGTLTSDEESMNPRPAPPVATLSIMLSYSSQGQVKTWSLRASARSLSLRLLRPLFDADSQNGCLDVLDHIEISMFDVEYTFATGAATTPKASSFKLLGILKLGELDLALTFTRDAKGFDFVADLHPDSPGSTIASIINSIVPGAADSLPEFVGSIAIDPFGTSAVGSPLCKLEYKTGTTKAGKKAGILSCLLKIAGFTLSFIQMKVRGTIPTQSTTKRVLRISVDQIPFIDRVPIVGQMPQPFDTLLYEWVEDGRSKLSPALDPSKLGFTQAELDDIQSLCPTIPPIQTKSTVAASSPSDSPRIALAAGHHFVVIVSGTVIIDHVFNTSRAETSSKPVTDGNPGPGPSSLSAGQSGTIADAPPTKGNTSTSAGPLKIQALTFQYKSGHLLVSIDATLTLGPISFSVIGFVIDINLIGVKLDHLADIVTKGLLSVDLHGIEVGLSQGPLTLKGVFIHEKAKKYESYSGGIAVGIKAWQVLAVGQYYVQLDDKGNEDFKAVFIYGKLDGPLVELEFATISGVRVGFGYNFAIRMPDLNELTTFPLINDKGLSDAGNDPLVVLNAIRSGQHPFVYPQKDAVWFAAGMTITAFDVITLTAVAVVDIEGAGGPNPGVVIAMFADGVFQMEPEAPPDFTLFYIELVVKVEFNLVHGYIAADAALAPASHIYVPMAHLTGSASFYAWFGPSEHAGDWVVSIGGYARGYQPAPWYPRPSRIALNFTVGDCIQIMGEGYCAVTPKCAMAGGRLHLSLDVGPVSAWADLTFDAFINFKPFHFRAEISLSVGVSCHVDIGLIHIHIGITLGADLQLWGPHDFGGRAHVNFWFFGFDIAFGAAEDPKSLEAATLDKFIDMVTQPGPPGDVRDTDTLGATGQANVPHKFSVEKGLAPLGTPPAPDKGNNFPSTGATREWHVLAGTLVIRVDCGFALSTAFLSRALVQGRAQTPMLILGPNGVSAPDVYSWPMHCQAGQKIKSELTLTIRHIISDRDQPIVDGFRAELVSKAASKALWAPWSSKLDPLHDAGPHPEHLKNADDGTVDLVQSVRILAPLPHRAPSKIIDMDAAAAMIFTIPGDWKLPSLTATEQTKATTVYAPSMFEPTKNGTARWADFQQLLVAPTSDATATAAQTAMKVSRQLVLDAIAETQEWTVRPPDQMSRATKDSTTAASQPITVVDNKPRVLANGRTDYQLPPELPVRMIELLDNYCLALPQVCAS